METIVNAYVGDGWYDKGSTRLRDTLFEHEWYNLITFRNIKNGSFPVSLASH
jgi:hypothetical protein